MKNVKRCVSIVLVCLMIVSLLTACGSNAHVGTWIADKSNTLIFPDTLVLEKDGDCDYNDLGLTYELEDGKLRLWMGGISLVYGCKVSGKDMTLTYEGEEMHYTKEK